MEELKQNVEKIEKLQEIENFKYRLERAKEQGAKQILSDLGANSLQSAKEKIEAVTNYEKQVSDLQKQIAQAKNLEYKVQAMQSGIDDKFVDFAIHELQSKVTDTENFSSLLAKFKEENPQYLRTQSGVKFSTAPNFENKASVPIDTHAFMNALIKRPNNTINTT